MPTEPRIRTLILGAAGRDFHNFNMVYREDPAHEVVAFTATQIPGIAQRRYPPALAGPLYPEGIPIEDEAELEALCRTHAVRQAVFAYSDVPHAHVMHLASRALAVGADFLLLGPERTMLRARRPVIAVSAIRTGCGKSQTTRFLARRLRERGLRVAVLRHPMPYGDLARQRVQRFGSRDDLIAADCTLEEREEYEPHIAAGGVVFAGVDYAAILAAAEAEADAILWDGGNNDFPFLRSDLHIVMGDALRPGQAATHHPGEAVLRMADVVVVNKVDAAPPGQADRVAAELAAVNPRAVQVRAASPARLTDATVVHGRAVLVIEDGPTITHGGMAHGAGLVAVEAAGGHAVDPRPHAVGTLAAVYRDHPHIGPVLPAMGYGAVQLRDLAASIERAEREGGIEAVAVASPVDLAALIRIPVPAVRVGYDYADAGEPTLGGIVDAFLDRRGAA